MASRCAYRLCRGSLGTSYSDAEKKVARHGWRETSNSGGCNRPESSPGGEFDIELGHIAFGVPVVPYVFAKFEFDARCRLVGVKIIKETDAL
jgi:hypothetical protein